MFGGCGLGAVERARKSPGDVDHPGFVEICCGQPRTTLPAFRQEVHTFSRFRWEMPTFACTVWMFGFQRRLVRRWECETDLPKPGPLPQTSQTAATSVSFPS